MRSICCFHCSCDVDGLSWSAFVATAWLVEWLCQTIAWTGYATESGGGNPAGVSSEVVTGVPRAADAIARSQKVAEAAPLWVLHRRGCGRRRGVGAKKALRHGCLFSLLHFCSCVSIFCVLSCLVCARSGCGAGRQNVEEKRFLSVVRGNEI